MMKDQAEKLREMAKNFQASRTRIITVTSGKGGVGKTNFTVNLAIALAQRGLRVVVLDADLGLANIDVLFGIRPKFHLYHVLKGQKTMLEALEEGPEGVRILAGGSGIRELANLTDEQREHFLASLAELEKNTDFLIIDTGAGLSQNVMGFVLAADEVFVITTPEPTAIADAYGMITAIAGEETRGKVRLIINRVGSVLEGRNVSERVITVARQFLNVEIEPFGFIFDDPAVGEAVRRREPFIMASPQARASACVRHLVPRLLGEEEQDIPQNEGLRGFFNKIIRIIQGNGSA